MIRPATVSCVFSLVLFCSVAMAATADLPPLPTEQSLILSWEAARKANPDTVSLERLEEGRYRYVNKRLEYDGELLVHSSFIDDAGAAGSGYVVGVVEAELTGADAAFFRRHGLAYERWRKANTLYYDPQSRSWLTEAQWAGALTNFSAPATKRLRDRLYTPIAAGIVLVSLLVLLVLLLLRLKALQSEHQRFLDDARRMQAEALGIGRQSLDYQLRTHSLLEALLEAVKKSPSRAEADQERTAGEP